MHPCPALKAVLVDFGWAQYLTGIVFSAGKIWVPDNFLGFPCLHGVTGDEHNAFIREVRSSVDLFFDLHRLFGFSKSFFKIIASLCMKCDSHSNDWFVCSRSANSYFGLFHRDLEDRKCYTTGVEAAHHDTVTRVQTKYWGSGVEKTYIHFRSWPSIQSGHEMAAGWDHRE